MSYMHIENLYKEQRILLFKECYAMEKIHGTSAHISYNPDPEKLSIFSRGSNYESFVALFDTEKLLQKFRSMELKYPVVIYGEAYGGKLQGMKDTYGDKMAFVAFEVKIGDCWLNVPKAEKFVKDFDIDFVPYKIIPATLEAIDAELGTMSIQAIKNGMGIGHMREGIVLRPPEEMVANDDHRIIAKHKNDAFKETKTSHKVLDPEKLEILNNAKAIADEWVTMERLKHVLDKNIADHSYSIEKTGYVIKVMIEDIIREAEGEIIDSPEARKEIGKQTALLYKNFLKS